MTEQQQSQGTERAEGPGPSPGAVAEPTAPLKVVVADDHPLWRDAVARDLAEAGMTVLATADDGPSAVNRTKATRPDVLVLDLNLPGMRGRRGDRARGGGLHAGPGRAGPGGVPQDVHAAAG